jgi:hypothetical protein
VLLPRLAVNIEQGSVNSTGSGVRRIALITVHGVSERYRYSQLDRFALSLRKAMQDGMWNVPDPTLVETLVDKSNGKSVANTVPAVLRLTPTLKDTSLPTPVDEIEIWESYWSPMGKNHAPLFQFAKWVLTYPRMILRSRPYPDVKAWDDFRATLLAIVIILCVAIAPIWIAVWAFTLTPISLPAALLAICYTVSIAVIVSDSILAGTELLRRVSEKNRNDPKDTARDLIGRGHELLADLFWLLAMLPKLFAAAALVFVGIHLNPFGDQSALSWPRLVALAIDSATIYLIYGPLAKASGIISDIVAYSAINENERLSAVHDSIIQKTADDMMSVLLLRRDKDAQECEKRYDEVWVFGHSLGASVAYEALLLLYRNTRQGGLDPTLYQKIRGFITYGSAIEKIENYLVDRDARRGYVNTGIRGYAKNMFRTACVPEDERALWLNFWFRRDVIASSMSDEQFRGVCTPIELPNPRLFWSHGDYEKDPNFWEPIIRLIA